MDDQSTMTMPPLLPCQVEATQRVLTNPYYALIPDMGVGKSRIIINAWRNRHIASPSPVDLLIIAPKGCYLNWLTFPPPKGLDPELGELDKWLTPEEREGTAINYWKADAGKLHTESLQRLLNVTARPRFLTVNVEALNRPGKARDYVYRFVLHRNVMVVIDESTCIDQWTSARTEWITSTLRVISRYRYIMTGLPAPESPMNLFSQYYWLEPRILGENYYSFQNRYAIIEQINFTPMRERTLAKPGRAARVIVGWRSDATAKLAAKIAPHSYRVEIGDVLDLPPQSYSYWDVDMTPEQERAYAEMKARATTALANAKHVTAAQAAHQLALLHHILCGHAKAEDGVVTDIPSFRVDALLEIIAEHVDLARDKAVIFAPYPRALEKIATALAQRYDEESVLRYWGETSQSDRIDARVRIQKDEAARFMVSNPSVGGKGGTWTRPALVIYFANSFDQEDRTQSERRIWRQGQTRPVHYIDMRVRGSIETRIIALLRRKKLVAAELTGDKWREWLE